MGFFDEGGTGNPVDVAALFDSGVPTLVAEIVSAGALVSIGRTSDGGALGITVTLDGRWRREYFRDSDEATDWLMQAHMAVLEEAQRAPASSGSRRRTRRS
jgi:hypothetical protein